MPVIQEKSILLYEERIDLYEKTKTMLPGLLYSFCNSRSAPSDLEVIAEIALWKATAKFDPSTNLQFATYAWKYVVGALKHELRDFSRLIRIPGWYQLKNPGCEIEIVPLNEDLDLLEAIPDTTNFDIPLDMFIEEVPVKYHQGLKWFLRIALYDETQVEIARAEHIDVNRVSYQVDYAQKSLYKSAKIREWAGYYGDIRVGHETFNLDTLIDGKKEYNDIDPYKNVQEIAKKNLTKIELKILALAGVGRNDKEVADIIGISPNTIRNQLESIYRKLNNDNKQVCFTTVFGVESNIGE